MKHLLLSGLLLASMPALAQQAPKSDRSSGSPAVFAGAIAAVVAALAARKKQKQKQK